METRCACWRRRRHPPTEELPHEEESLEIEDGYAGELIAIEPEYNQAGEPEEEAIDEHVGVMVDGNNENIAISEEEEGNDEVIAISEPVIGEVLAVT